MSGGTDRAAAGAGQRIVTQAELEVIESKLNRLSLFARLFAETTLLPGRVTLSLPAEAVQEAAESIADSLAEIAAEVHAVGVPSGGTR